VQLLEPLAGHRHADEPAAVARHEVDRVRRRELRGDRQVTLVLAVLIVDDDHEPPVAVVLDRLLDAREAARAPRLLLADLRQFRLHRSLSLSPALGADHATPLARRSSSICST
jgi:hypothetical protein